MSQVIYKERKHTDCTKWDGCEEKFGKDNLLPLWVADMDFEVPACVKEAVKEYADFGIYGYYMPTKGYEDAFIRWEKEHHNYEICREWMRFAPGVVPAINWLIHILTQENDKIMIMPPVYYPFRDAIVNNNRIVVENPLVREECRYVMNYEDFEQKIVEHDVKLFILCSPHNPVGRVWSSEELEKILSICKKHHVYVIADEIHQDIIMTGYEQVVAASTGDFDDILVTVTAATKTFNLAGCQNSIVIIPDQALRELYDDHLTKLRIKNGNAFGYIAVQSAYEGGGEWLEEVLQIIEGNYHYLKETLQNAFPDIWIPNLEGTYLMWIDLGKYIEAENMEQIIQEQCNLAVDYGNWFGGNDYGTFIRVNLATRRENIELAAQRIIDALKK